MPDDFNWENDESGEKEQDDVLDSLENQPIESDDSAYGNFAGSENGFGEKKTYGGGGTKPPSQKQIDFATKISEATGVALPEGYDSDWKIISTFIEENKEEFSRTQAASSGGAPSDKQLAFAMKIAKTLDIETPDNIDSDWKITKKFIDDNMSEFEKKAPAGKPTEKQIAFAKKIAEKSKNKPTKDMFSDYKKLSKYIDENKANLYS